MITGAVPLKLAYSVDGAMRVSSMSYARIN